MGTRPARAEGRVARRRSLAAFLKDGDRGDPRAGGQAARRPALRRGCVDARPDARRRIAARRASSPPRRSAASRTGRRSSRSSRCSPRTTTRTSTSGTPARSRSRASAPADAIAALVDQPVARRAHRGRRRAAPPEGRGRRALPRATRTSTSSPRPRARSTTTAASRARSRSSPPRSRASSAASRSCGARSTRTCASARPRRRSASRRYAGAHRGATTRCAPRRSPCSASGRSRRSSTASTARTSARWSATRPSRAPRSRRSSQPIFASGSTPLQVALADAVGRLRVMEAAPTLLDEGAVGAVDRTVRIAALRALAAMRHERMAAGGARRAAGQGRAGAHGRAHRHPAAQSSRGHDDRAARRRSSARARSPSSSRRSQAMGQVPGATGREAMTRLVEQLEQGKLAPEIQLDVAEAARATKDPALIARLDKLANRPGAKPRGRVRGRAPRRRRAARSARRLPGAGGAVHAVPQLRLVRATTSDPTCRGVASRLTREQLLEALVDPSARIAPGFGPVQLTLKNGKKLFGTLKEETDDARRRRRERRSARREVRHRGARERPLGDAAHGYAADAPRDPRRRRVSEHAQGALRHGHRTLETSRGPAACRGASLSFEEVQIPRLRSG